MAFRPSIALALGAALVSLGASYRTQNFIVEAPNADFAKRVGDWAEHYRQKKAIEWLGHEMRPWGQPCPLRVTVSMNGSSGATSFAFDRGAILSMDMHIEGTPDRLIASVLPHEITHTVIAYYFRMPVPRWADEGGSVLSEDEPERQRHEQIVRNLLRGSGRAIPLRRLFNLRDYPPHMNDVMSLYAQGYSVTNFLVRQSSRPEFLAFVARGMQGDWDGALRTHYRYNSVEELERAWLQHIREGGTSGMQLAANRGRTEAMPTSRIEVRQTIPPRQPLLQAPQPVYRAQAPDDYADRRARPQYDYRQTPPPAVRLGAPEFDSAPPRWQPFGSEPRP